MTICRHAQMLRRAMISAFTALAHGLLPFLYERVLYERRD